MRSLLQFNIRISSEKVPVHEIEQHDKFSAAQDSPGIKLPTAVT